MAAIVGKDYTIHVYQNGFEQQNFGDVYRSKQPFQAVWIYTPNPYEQAAGARGRQVISEIFKGGTGWAQLIGAMRNLREDNLMSRGPWTNTPELMNFIQGLP